MKCHHCESKEYRKNGRYQNVQRYICKQCGRSFTSRGERYAKSVKEHALTMYLNNVGIRKIARFVSASPAGVLKWIRAARGRLAEQLHTAADSVEKALPDVIEMDEIYTYVQKKANGPSFGLLIVDGNVALLPIR